MFDFGGTETVEHVRQTDRRVVSDEISDCEILFLWTYASCMDDGLRAFSILEIVV